MAANYPQAQTVLQGRTQQMHTHYLASLWTALIFFHGSSPPLAPVWLRLKARNERRVPELMPVLGSQHTGVTYCLRKYVTTSFNNRNVL